MKVPIPLLIAITILSVVFGAFMQRNMPLFSDKSYANHALNPVNAYGVITDVIETSQGKSVEITLNKRSGGSLEKPVKFFIGLSENADYCEVGRIVMIIPSGSFKLPSREGY